MYDNITKAHVLTAVKEVEQEGKALIPSTKFDVIINGKPYPPKEIMRLASKLANGSSSWPFGGGEPTNKFLRSMGFEIQPKATQNTSPQAALIQRYKMRVSKDHNAGEVYKWELLNRQHWKPDAPDLLEMVKSIPFQNLVYPLGIAVIHRLAALFPEDLRKLLLMLFDDEQDLQQRISDFITGTRELYRRDEPKMNHHQDERTIATYLTYHRPDKYAFYKASFYRKYCALLGVSPAKTGERYVHYLRLLQEFISDYVAKDTELLQLAETFKTPQSFTDESHLLLGQDILYTTLDYEDDEDEEEQPGLHSTLHPSKLNDMALNTILYGPPGTGKTYHTVQRAISIANPKFDLSQSREKIKEEYDRLRDEGQIEFITFHQSLSYEDFIEGIKPQKPASEDTFLKYKVEDGILKRLALKAVYKPDVQTKVFSLPEAAYEQAQFYKMSLGSSQNEEDEAIYRYCIDNGYIALGWGGDTDFSNMSEAQITAMVKSGGIERFTGQAINYLIHYIKAGDYVIISNGNSFCRAIGRVTGAYEYAADSGIWYHQFRKVDWLIKDVNIPVEELYDRPFSQQSIYQIDKKGLKKDFFVKPIAVATDRDAEQLRNFVLIIDEINRGNVSAIFGELITLIEEDKRAGGPEALKVTLPYSGDTFSLPSNLYIIGTMNTADRSVEALDTALRRRFSFIEMAPVEDHEKIPADVLIDGQTFNFREVLKTINRRLEKLTGRDHKIGHSYFMLGKAWEEYLQAFTDKIIPLLQEYFYGDWAKMCLVLGEGFVHLKAEPQKDETLFALLPQGRQTAIGDSLQDLAEKEVWQLTDWKEAGPQMFAAALKSLAPTAATTPAHDNS